MKLSGYILIILMTGLCFAIVGSIVNDFAVYYPDVQINTSWETKYNYANSINQSVSGVKERFDIIEDEDTGWFTKLTAGIEAVPLAIITVPRVMFETIATGFTIVSDLGKEIGIPPFVITITIIAIIIIVLFALVSFWHRSKA